MTRIARCLGFFLLLPWIAPAAAQQAVRGHFVDAETGAALRAQGVEIRSTRNDNTSFSLFASWPKGDRECRRAALVIDRHHRAADGWGGDANRCSANFVLDASDAARAARAFGVPLRRRQPNGERVEADFAASAPSVAVGTPVEVVLTLTHRGGPPVRWQRGGRNRGPRDNQFSLRVFRDGAPVATIEAPDFGGLSILAPLSTGERVELRAPIAAWADISRPGHYEVRCSFETAFASASETEHASDRLWERRFEGVIRFEVR